MIYSKNVRDTALELFHRFGLWPVAIRAGSKIPIGWSKVIQRPTAQSIKDVFVAYPDAGVGLVLGPQGGVIDIECDGPQGMESLAKLFDGAVPATMGWSSARGPHHLFRYNPRLTKYGKNVIMFASLPDLEIRIGSERAPLQSNCPPTLCDNGRPRIWNNVDVIAELPDVVFDFLDAHQSEMLDHGGDLGSANLDDLHQEICPVKANPPVPGATTAGPDPYLALITSSWARLKSQDKRFLAEAVMDRLAKIAV